MPNIRTFQAPNLGLQPSETGVQATAQAANRIGRFYNQAGSDTERLGSQTAAVGEDLARGIQGDIKAVGDVAVQYAEHQEISHGAATFAQLNDNLTQAWNKTAQTADPNDPTVAAKFRETVLEPALDQYREGFLTEGGQKFAEARIDALRNHLFEKTAADMSSLAKDAVSVNVSKTANSLSNTAMSDPSSVPHLVESAGSLVDGMVSSAPNLKGAGSARARLELTQKMRENIVKSGAIGAIASAADPEAEAQRWGEKYPDYISGSDLKALSANARQQIRARRTDEAYALHIQKERAQEVSDAREGDYLKGLYSTDPQERGQVSSRNIVNDPNLTREAKERMIRLVDREMKPETDAHTSAQTSAGIFGMMRDPNADPEKIKAVIFDARAKDPGSPGSINRADFNDLMKNLIDLKTPEGQAVAKDRNDFFKAYAGTIDGYLAQNGLHSALGQQRMYQAEKDAIAQERAMKAQGKDPRSIYDPSSPDFFGRPENIARYHVSMQQANQFTAGLVTAGPGDTAAVTPIPVASEFKNFFSSGRAAKQGVNFNPTTDLTTITTTGGQSLTVNKMAAPHFDGFLKALEAEGYKINSVGGYADRNKRGGSTPSEHAFGNAIDINPGSNAQHSGKSDLPANVAELASKYGLIWGGNWKGASNDPMHFEWSGAGAGNQGGPVRVTTAAEYGALAAGTRYTAPDGSIRIKGGK